MHEFELIKQCFSNWGIEHEGVDVGIGDDCLLWRSPEPLVISTDTAVVGRHFPSNATPEQVANRVFLPALSDIAAMCAKPAFFTLALTLPKELTELTGEEWVIAFAQQLRKLATQYNCVLAGGDTTSGSQLTVTTSVHGTCAHPVMRSGAVEDDDVWVSGNLGQAAAALEYVLKGTENKAPQHWVDAYWSPQPQIELGKHLLGIVHSAIDISDGLVGDAAHIAKASNVDLHLNCQDIPRDEQLLQLEGQGLEQALAGGDDYQLCFTASTLVRKEIEQISKDLEVKLSRIGTIKAADKAGSGVVHWYDGGHKIDLPWQSFKHF